jgi:hypothetical protein
MGDAVDILQVDFAHQSSIISTMVGHLLALLVTACVFPINSGFVAAGKPAFRNVEAADNQKQDKNVISMSSCSTSDDTKDDVQDFHQYAAAAVDLSDAHVSESGLLSRKLCL